MSEKRPPVPAPPGLDHEQIPEEPPGVAITGPSDESLHAHLTTKSGWYGQAVCAGREAAMLLSNNPVAAVRLLR